MRFEIGFTSPLLAIALASACSDDGLAMQSSGQAETSTTGGPVNDAITGTGSAPGSSAGGDDETRGAPEGTTSSSSDGSGDSSTLGPAQTTGPGTDGGTSTGTGGTETEGTTGGPSQACIDGCAVEFMCGTEWASAEDCVAWCESNLVLASDFSPFCRDAWEALSACLATLTCDEFGQWQNPTEFPYPCSDADTALSIECKGQ